jgi:hypothetical protein
MTTVNALLEIALQCFLVILIIVEFDISENLFMNNTQSMKFIINSYESSWPSFLSATSLASLPYTLLQNIKIRLNQFFSHLSLFLFTLSFVIDLKITEKQDSGIYIGS